ncbi:uncharacterized protein B0P05DRAFT_573049 [Gilbertella persicaria]|uniref:uncharacterized protein n=1 Tax=Gilbertella persicaria TaxID=101096 RepID=UPI00221ECCB4|nr:uncharacterized protein B0P05DRAFT_573049 [Gilbertella persicaria]KAI8073515.1 hypothetical protein B0P05DRAFT_573049 [Gilbertella persicaria]
MSNKYNVLVDMEEAAYSQPATIESDGLEFQDFSSNQNMNKSSYNTPLPGATTATTATANNAGFFDTPTSQSNVGKPIWSVEYYAQFFDVNTSQVIERCLKSMYPVGDFAHDTLNNNPDLYGPFWIATSVVFSVFVCSSLAGSLAAYMSGKPYVYDFTLLSFAVVVVYIYAFLCPTLVWASTKYFGCQPSLLEIINYYGYGLTIWIPVSLLCIIPFDYARWGFVGVAFIVTTVFLVKNLYIVISRAEAKTSRIILLAILLAHMIFTLVLKMAFYRYDITLLPADPPVFKSRRQQKLWEKEKKQIEARKIKSYVNQAPFRYVERNFKSRVTPPDFTHVIDFEHLDRNTQENNETIVKVQLTDDLKNLSHLFGDREDTPACRDAYILKHIPGLIIIPHAFTPKAQRHLIKQCLSVYPQPPNTSNLDTHYIIPKTGIWPLYEAQEQGLLKAPDFYVPKKTQVGDSAGYSDSDSEEDQAMPTACSDQFKPVIDQEKPDPPPAPGVPLLPPNELVRKLRWVTLGYQYHWPTKTYHLDRQYPFPNDVSELTKAVVTAIENIGYQSENEHTSWLNQYKGEDFKAEAGVVNYYQYRDTLMGHVDRSELNMEAPLVSLRWVNKRHCTNTFVASKW